MKVKEVEARIIQNHFEELNIREKNLLEDNIEWRNFCFKL